MDLGFELRRLRKERRWTQAEVAEKAGLGHSHYAKIEKGTRLPTKLQQLVQLAEVFGLPAGYFGKPEELLSTSKKGVILISGLAASESETRVVEPQQLAEQRKRLKRAFLLLAGQPDDTGALPPVEMFRTTFKMALRTKSADGNEEPRLVEITVFPPPDSQGWGFLDTFSKALLDMSGKFNDVEAFAKALATTVGSYVSIRDVRADSSVTWDAWAPGMENLKRVRLAQTRKPGVKHKTLRYVPVAREEPPTVDRS